MKVVEEGTGGKLCPILLGGFAAKVGQHILPDPGEKRPLLQNSFQNLPILQQTFAQF